MRIPPENLEAARPVMEQMIRVSSAEAGCRDYAYAIDLLDPCLVRITGRWESREALTAHFKAAHSANWRSFFPQRGTTERAPALYEAGHEPT